MSYSVTWQRWQIWFNRIWAKPKRSRSSGMTRGPATESSQLETKCWFYYQLLLASFWPNGKVPIQCWSVWAIKSMRSISAMPTLENRSLYLKLCTLYKIIYGCFYFHPMFLYLSQVEFFTIVPPISLTSCPHQLFAFVSSTISIRPWNTLLVCCWVLHKLQSFWL